MDEPIDFCAYFADIEKDPTAKTPTLTIGQFLRARLHVSECQDCVDRIERAMEDLPEDDEPEIGFTVN